MYITHLHIGGDGKERAGTTNQEAIDIIKNGRHDPMVIEEALKMAIAALEKREPKKVTEIHCDEYYCPSCGSENMADCYKVGDNYCPVCGQALEWEE